MRYGHCKYTEQIPTTDRPISQDSIGVQRDENPTDRPPRTLTRLRATPALPITARFISLELAYVCSTGKLLGSIPAYLRPAISGGSDWVT
jgi:hypothetical protein